MIDLDAVAAALAGDPRCAGAVVERGTRTLEFSSRSSDGLVEYDSVGGLRATSREPEVLLITHPSTSTEFLVFLRTGTQRASLFHELGTLDGDTYLALYAAEPAGLHAPGHDDSGRTRSDGQSAGVWAMLATARPNEVVDRLAAVFGQRAVAPDRPATLDRERADLARWAAPDEPAAGWLTAEPGAVDVVARLDPVRLRHLFPRDAKNRLEARAQVLLAALDEGRDRTRRRFVLARGPRRVGGGDVTVRIEAVVAANVAHRFDLMPWCWRADAGALTDPATWGYDGADADAVALLSAGDVPGGLAAAGLDLDEGVARLVQGLPVGVIADDPDWPVVARERLCRLAPWLLRGPGVAYARGPGGRGTHPMRLFSLPNGRGPRRAAVLLVPLRRPRLVLQWAKTNAVLPQNLWQRPPVPGVW
ncbi:hypothetical protein [Virgisporangium aurantiacum]|uniref:Uncharacterized protein n=1 Tax=Virgisporangium aurantiacum TaxID=175570 RepID=A0A8J3ZIN3_9ACTN|nr:hypothetical protein [Virgisporangium aurantiacum]GIJ64516.1 hypothetical protein Vau01_120320 [Virgisporangium aurantiacum]